tara:strand:+ start:146457 stop:147521 length:1065 start_codon:yes stop_codon:yes gene_type:complete
MRIKILFIIIVAATLALATAGYLYVHHLNSVKLNTPKPVTATIVSFAKVKQEMWQTRVESIGSINGNEIVSLNAQEPGAITKIYAAAASKVQKGDKLFQIDSQGYQAQLNRDLAQLRLSKFTYIQYQKLYKAAAISLETLLEAKAKYQLAQADVKLAQHNLTLTTVRAPTAGIVGLNLVNVGDYVAVGKRLAMFQSIQDLRVDFSIPERYADVLKKGERVDLLTSSAPNKIIPAVVSAFEPFVDPSTGSINVRASLVKPTLLPGANVEVNIYLGVKQATLVIPQTAVMQSLNGNYVYKVVNGRAVRTVITMAERRGNVIAITQGLKEGETIVSAGQMKITNNGLVTNKNALVVK